MSIAYPPTASGLYDPRNEHDSCGIGFVVDIKNRKSHEPIRQGLEILACLSHRGAVGADPLAGDGAGILLQVPDDFLRAECAELGIELPAVGDYAVGMIFLPRDQKARTSAAAGRVRVVKVVEGAIDEMKALDVKVLDVHGLTDITDTMIIASGTSDRHVRSIADRVIEHAKKAGFRPMGVEGERDGEWVLVDLQDVIVHIMLPRVREFYRLESLWDVSAARRERAERRA